MYKDYTSEDQHISTPFRSDENTYSRQRLPAIFTADHGNDEEINLTGLPDVGLDQDQKVSQQFLILLLCFSGLGCILG